MIWLVAADLLPEALETSRPIAVAGTVTASAVAMAVWWSRPAPCIVESLGGRLAQEHLVVGGAMSGPTFVKAPFDVRYHYVAGGVPDAACDDCRACTVDGVTCANPSECGWWGWGAEAARRTATPGRGAVGVHTGHG